MKFALYNRKTKSVISWYGSIPAKITLPEHLLEVHAPTPGWKHEDLAFLEVEEVKGHGAPTDDSTYTISYAVKGNKLRIKYECEPVPLQDAKANALAYVDSESSIRARSIAPMDPYRQMMYCIKYTQARVILDQCQTVSEDKLAELYPLVAIDVGVTAKDMRDAAWKILEAAHEWGRKVATLEKTRREAKAAIQKANSVFEVSNLRQSIRW